MDLLFCEDLDFFEILYGVFFLLGFRGIKKMKKINKIRNCMNNNYKVRNKKINEGV